jgi:ribonuclease HIII
MALQPFVATLDEALISKLQLDLKEQGFEFSHPPHTRFTAKKPGLTCTVYESGKMVIQGKEQATFIEFYIEPHILKAFSYSHPLAEVDLTPRIGVDESGKGDFFGPLCIAGVYATEKDFVELQRMGVKDSKNLSDKIIIQLADKIKKQCLYHIVKINPAKYNQIYESFKNLNRLLAWGHATVIEKLVEKSGCQSVLIDQFADPSVVKQALKNKQLNICLSQRHRAEADLAVAAASILARQAFLEGLDSLSKEAGIVLPKGASSAVLEAGIKIGRQYGSTYLTQVCKQHFKTFQAIIGYLHE